MQGSHGLSLVLCLFTSLPSLNMSVCQDSREAFHIGARGRAKGRREDTDWESQKQGSRAKERRRERSIPRSLSENPPPASLGCRLWPPVSRAVPDIVEANHNQMADTFPVFVVTVAAVLAAHGQVFRLSVC
ncbi:unnamed protein product [Protopolystoma xenopodis]|uniref:Uncharacterized protein n=1 Tax=Protopolystoma xenopodis TaxID=117903 RepID=A0A448XRU3_9PLAT|nr:unnamed protein product [Protopolystoma xenopodis]